MLSRLEAIQDIRIGRGISNAFVGIEMNDRGVPTSYNAIIRRSVCKTHATLIFDCRQMGTLPRNRETRQVQPIRLTARQVLNYIRRNYPRHADNVQVNPTLPNMPIAKVA